MLNPRKNISWITFLSNKLFVVASFCANAEAQVSKLIQQQEPRTERI